MLPESRLIGHVDNLVSDSNPVDNC